MSNYAVHKHFKQYIIENPSSEDNHTSHPSKKHAEVYHLNHLHLLLLLMQLLLIFSCITLILPLFAPVNTDSVKMR